MIYSSIFVVAAIACSALALNSYDSGKLDYIYVITTAMSQHSAVSVNAIVCVCVNVLLLNSHVFSNLTW